MWNCVSVFIQVNISFLLDVNQNSTPGDIILHLNASRWGQRVCSHHYGFISYVCLWTQGTTIEYLHLHESVISLKICVGWFWLHPSASYTHGESLRFLCSDNLENEEYLHDNSISLTLPLKYGVNVNLHGCVSCCDAGSLNYELLTPK